MALFKKFYTDKLSVRFFPDQKVIYMEPQKGLNPSKLRSFKEKIETYLNVESSNFNKVDGKPTFSIKLQSETQTDSIEELLKQMFHGGDSIEDPSTIASFEDAEKENDKEVTAQDVQQQQQPQESVKLKAYSLFFESTYRTAEYWDNLVKVIGTDSKQKINADDILAARKVWTGKPKSKKRDGVLRDLDKAMRYFSRKLRNQMGPGAGNFFKKKYREIGNLTPSDYKEEKSPMDSELPTLGDKKSEGGPTSDLDFSEFFTDKGEKKKKEKEADEEEDFYKDFETKE